MKLIILVACALVAVAVAAPAEKDVPIVRSEYQQQPEGGYNFDFETGDGTKRQEEGTLKDAVDEENKPHKVVAVRGSYSYVDPEGKPQAIVYYADETGYHADGESVPKAPGRR